MRRMLNVLYVTTQGAYLARQRETVLVRVEGKTRLRVPIHTLEGIICFGNVSASPFLLGLCAEHQVAVSFLSERGRFLARVQGPVSGNVLLRRSQYRLADDPRACAVVAGAVVAAKLANCRQVLLRAARVAPDPSSSELRGAGQHLARLVEQVLQEDDLGAVRGLEGEGARVYFGVFDHLITSQHREFRFVERNRRPPLDAINALLSFLYTLLVHDVASALEGVGLDPAVGFLHRDRPGRPSLALDLMEELRPVLADRLALSLVNRRQVRPKGFRKSESGAVMMDDATRKKILIAFQERKRSQLRHPFLEEKIPLGMVAHAQALLLARYLRGDLDAYPPFLWR